MWFWAILTTSHVSAATVDFTLAVDRTVPSGAVTFAVRGQWLDETVSVNLTDEDGVSGDGRWTGSLTGESTRMLPISLVMMDGTGREVELSSSTEMLDIDGGSITWALDGDPRVTTPRARRVALARPARQMERFELASTVAGLGWFGIVFLYVAWWVSDRAGTRRGRRRGRG